MIDSRLIDLCHSLQRQSRKPAWKWCSSTVVLHSNSPSDAFTIDAPSSNREQSIDDTNIASTTSTGSVLPSVSFSLRSSAQHTAQLMSQMHTGAFNKDVDIMSASLLQDMKRFNRGEGSLIDINYQNNHGMTVVMKVIFITNMLTHDEENKTVMRWYWLWL